MKKILSVLAVCALVIPAASAYATGLTGNLNVSGLPISSFTNSINTIGNTTSFTYNGLLSDYAVSFNGSDLFITDTCTNKLTCSISPKFTMTFTDPDFLAATAVSNALGLSSTLTGDVLTFTYGGGRPGGGKTNTTAVSEFAIAMAPEPNSLVLLATGLCGLAGLAWFARRRQVRL